VIRTRQLGEGQRDYRRPPMTNAAKKKKDTGQREKGQKARTPPRQRAGEKQGCKGPSKFQEYGKKIKISHSGLCLYHTSKKEEHAKQFGPHKRKKKGRVKKEVQGEEKKQGDNENSNLKKKMVSGSRKTHNVG